MFVTFNLNTVKSVSEANIYLMIDSKYDEVKMVGLVGWVDDLDEWVKWLDLVDGDIK